MKCLSKGWYRFITHYRQSRPRYSTTSFFCNYKFSGEEEKSQAILLKAKDQGGERIESFEHRYLNLRTPKHLEFYGTSNGFLLCGRKYNVEYDKIAPHLYQYNPMLNQWVQLLSPRTLTIPSNFRLAMGLAAWGPPDDHNYRIVCFALHSEKIDTTGYVSCGIFSSETGEWRLHRSRWLNKSLEHNINTVNRSPPFVFQTGISVLHWVLDEHLLGYHIHRDFFKLIKLPKKKGDRLHGKHPRLWESEGCLQYSCSQQGKIHIWDLVHPNSTYKKNNKSIHAKWRLKYTIDFDMLHAQVPKIFNPAEPFSFDPCGFNEDLQIVYIQFQGMIISYSLETRGFRQAWSFTTPKDKSLWLGPSFCVELSSVKYSYKR